MPNVRLELTEEVWADWLQHPVTEALRKEILLPRLQELHRKWEAGDFTAESMEGTMQLNASAVGAAGVLRFLLEMDLEQLKGELDAGK